MKKDSTPKPTQIGLSIAEAYKDVGCITDPQSCYTGISGSKKEKPVQDADDL